MRNLPTPSIRLHCAILILAGGMLATASALAQDCLEYQVTNPQVVFENPGGSASAIAVAGDRAYLAVTGGVRVYDVSVPAQPSSLGLMAAAGYISDLSIAGTCLYVCSRDFGLRIASLNGGDVPTIIAEVPLPSGAHDIWIQDDVACIAAGATGLAIYDVADPVHPQPLATTTGAAPIYQLARTGGEIYGGSRAAGIQLVDVSDPTHPVTGSLLDADGNVTSLAVHAGHLYVGTYDARIRSYDLTVPTSPTLADDLALPDFPTSITTRDGALWLTAIATGMIEVDASDPSDLVVADFVEVPGLAFGAVHLGALTFVAGSPDLRILDLAQPSLDATLGWYRAPNGFTDLAVAGDRAYALDYFAGLITLDMTDPLHPVEINRLALTGENETITLSGDHAFIAAHLDGVRVIDLTDPDHPILATTLPLPGTVWDLAVTGSLLVAGVDNGHPDSIAIIDIASWRTPVLVGMTPVFHPGAIAASGSTAVVVSNGALCVVDLSEPTNPTVVASWQPAENVTGLAMTPDTVYLCEPRGEFTILDLTDPAAPTPSGHCATAPWTYDLFLAGDTAYLASETHGVLAVDVADLANPTYIGAARTAGAADQLTITAEAIYALTSEQGLTVTWPACTTTVSAVAAPPLATAMISAAPNPFNPRTVVRFDLPTAATTTLEIADIRGRAVCTLVAPALLPAGPHSYTWDGRDDHGRNQSAGVYLAKLRAGSDQSVVKVTLLK